MSPDEYFLPDEADQQQFEAEWQQWRQEQDEELDAYLIALCSYYGNRDET